MCLLLQVGLLRRLIDKKLLLRLLLLLSRLSLLLLRLRVLGENLPDADELFLEVIALESESGYLRPQFPILPTVG